MAKRLSRCGKTAGPIRCRFALRSQCSLNVPRMFPESHLQFGGQAAPIVARHLLQCDLHLHAE
eukprot:2293289-Pyramimonas_sp.AAC.1